MDRFDNFLGRLPSGVQLFALGIIGEYLGRMHMRTMERPPYIVRAGTTPGTEA